MCVYDESLTVARQMYEGWSRETGKLEILGQRMYLPGETIFLALFGACSLWKDTMPDLECV